MKIEFTTEIRDVDGIDFQVGVKSTQTIDINFDDEKIENSYKTGTTDILIMELESVRDDFSVSDIVFNELGNVSFTVTGTTASGIRVAPNIDYEFKVEISPDGVSVVGTHDGFPSYNVSINDTTVYDFEQGMEFELFGDSDVTVDVFMTSQELSADCPPEPIESVLPEFADCPPEPIESVLPEFADSPSEPIESVLPEFADSPSELIETVLPEFEDSPPEPHDGSSQVNEVELQEHSTPEGAG